MLATIKNKMSKDNYHTRMSLISMVEEKINNRSCLILLEKSDYIWIIQVE